MGKDNLIFFGPFIAKAQTRGGYLPTFENTGIAMEFAAAEVARVATIYRRMWPDSDDVALFGFSDFFIHQADLPCDVRAYGYSMKEVPDGVLIPLEDVLASLYQKYRNARPLRQVLEELREKLGPAHPSAPPPPNLLKPELAALGFRVERVFPYGRKLSVSLEWAPVADINQPSFCSVGMGFIEFVPERDRTLGKGKWIKPRADILGLNLRTELIHMFRGAPITIFSPQGVANLIDEFPWKPISLLTRKELDEAKTNFIRQHPELHNNLNELAKQLIAQGFYSEGSDRYVAKKYILKVLGNPGSNPSKS